MPTISFNSKPPPTEKTPLGISFENKPIPQGKNARSFFSQVVVVTLSSVVLGLIAVAYLSSSASSSVAKQSLLRSVNKHLYETNNVVPTASLIESESQIDLDETTDLIDLPKFILNFPSGVYDSSMESSASDLQGIVTSCIDADPNNPAEILGCQIYFDHTDIGTVTMALGTIKSDVNLIKIATTGIVEAADVSFLFEDYALAAMIDRNCFEWNMEENTYSATSVAYNTAESYFSALQKQVSQSVSASASYFAATVSAGYKHSSSDSSSTSSESATAYGQNAYQSPVGTLKNTCFDNQEIFEEKVRDLVKPEVVSLWKEIRNNELTEREREVAFKTAAKGGFFMPLHYHYKEGITTMLTAKYESTSFEQSTAASQAISAGLHVGFSVGASASVKGSLDKATKSASQSSGYTGTVDSTIIVTGNGINSSCLETKYACGTMITKAVKSVQKDLTKLGPPTSQTAFLLLDQLVQMYFGDGYGLPDAFHTYVETGGTTAPTNAPTIAPVLPCPTNCGPPGNGVECCTHFFPGTCHLNAPDNVCQCLSGPDNTQGAPCTIVRYIAQPILPCPADCGPEGNGKECCANAGVSGTCNLNGPENECECLSGPNNSKGAPCTIGAPTSSSTTTGVNTVMNDYYSF